MILAAVAAGCAGTGTMPAAADATSTPPDASAVTAAGPSTSAQPEDTTEFWHQLARRPVATNDAALHALVLYLDERDAADGYAARVDSLKQRGLLPADFQGRADAPLHRGTLAYAVVKATGIRGGITMQLMGPSGRYATKALEARRIFPAGSENQPFSGAQFVGVMGRLEDYQRGDATAKPAFLLPGEDVLPPLDVLAPPEPEAITDASQTDAAAPERASSPARPLLLSVDDPATRRAGQQPPAATEPATEKPVKLAVIVTGVEGPDVQVRAADDQPWVPARRGMKLGESAEFRTGPKSAVRFFIRPNHVFTLDRQGSLKVLQAYKDQAKVKTDMGLEHGRVRVAVERLPDQADPYRVEDAGLERECTIHSPNTALAVRGTLVSLYDQPPFAPEAVSLTGRAVFENVRRERVTLAGRRGAAARVSGAQTGAAEHAEQNASLPADSPEARNDFENQEVARVVSRGGFTVGDVLVGNSAGLPQRFPGDLNFVLNWTGTATSVLNDLNLVVISPDNVPGRPDFVANPPFTLSLDPASKTSQELRKNSREYAGDPLQAIKAYPRESASGGRIGLNHIGPEGREVAYWPAGYPVAVGAQDTYKIQVFNLVPVPASDPRQPAQQGTPVPFTIQVFQKNVGGHGFKQLADIKYEKGVRELETSPTFQVAVDKPADASSARRRSGRR
jgi:hypothetical protein